MPGDNAQINSLMDLVTPQSYSFGPPYGYASQSLIGGREANVQEAPPYSGGPPMNFRQGDYDWRNYMGRDTSTGGGFFTLQDLGNAPTQQPRYNPHVGQTDAFDPSAGQATLPGRGIAGIPQWAQAGAAGPSTNNYRMVYPGNINRNLIMRNGQVIDRTRQLDQPIYVWHGGADPEAGGGTYGRGSGATLGYPAFSGYGYDVGWGYWPGAMSKADFNSYVT